MVFVPHFIIVYRATGYALYHFTGGSIIISSVSHFTIMYQTAAYLIRTQHCCCISPMGEEGPCQFTSTLWLRLHQRRPLCTLLYCTYTPILTSHTHTHTHTHTNTYHLGFLLHCFTKVFVHCSHQAVGKHFHIWPAPHSSLR